jgi:glycosyltransferase involved in cell wall biosynthesis
MGVFCSYKIQYLELGSIDDKVAPADPTFLIFLYDDTPLGHLWVHGSKRLSKSEFIEQSIISISPAIAFYCKESETNADAWKFYLRQGNKVDLLHFLQTYIRPQDPRLSEKTKSAGLSVIICTRNRSKALKGCIESLFNSSDTDFELIVVDNAPDDNSTEQLVKSFCCTRYIRENRKGLDIARNTGAVNASHDIIAYTDDDVVVSKDWVKKLKACFVDPETFSVTGQVFPCNLTTEAQYMFERYWGFNKGYVPLLYDQEYFKRHCERGVPVWDIGAGANMAFRKEIFSLAGYFDERLDVGAAGCSGDSELWYRILAGGWSCRYYPDVYVYHNHRETKKELRKQLYNYMRGFVAALLVQHEKFHHKGNLVRLYRITPKWYFNRLKRAIKGRKEGFIFSEIKGYISGWRFYLVNKKKPPL